MLSTLSHQDSIRISSWDLDNFGWISGCTALSNRAQLIMPFGSVNSGRTFEKLMETVLVGLQLDICLLYIDDVIAYASKIMSRAQTYNSVTK